MNKNKFETDGKDIKIIKKKDIEKEKIKKEGTNGKG